LIKQYLLSTWINRKQILLNQIRKEVALQLNIMKAKLIWAEGYILLSAERLCIWDTMSLY
jgi:hypothetical protein